MSNLTQGELVERYQSLQARGKKVQEAAMKLDFQIEALKKERDAKLAELAKFGVDSIEGAREVIRSLEEEISENLELFESQVSAAESALKEAGY